MEITLTKNQRLVAKAASKENPHRSIHCVHIKDGIIEAADGFILVRKKLGYTGEELLLNAKQIDLLQDINYKTPVVLVDKGEDVLARSKYGRTLITKEKEKFPETEQLFPKKPPVFKIALSRSVLRKLLSSLDNSDHIPLQFYFYGTKDVVKVCEGEETTALAMPMYVEWKDDVGIL